MPAVALVEEEHMAKGLLKVNGLLDVNQFWPAKGSDGDTVNVRVDAKSFSFSPDPATKPFKTTRLFERCEVQGSTGRNAPIRNGEISIRFQGIDAPELHYEANLPQ